MLEHSSLRAGNFPLWLAPEQVRVLTLNDDEKLVAYAKEIHREQMRERSPRRSRLQIRPAQAKKRGWILTHLMAALLMGLAILAAGIFRR